MRCCEAWFDITDSVKVTARNFAIPEEHYKAKAVEQLIVYFIGQYCPTCGRRIRQYEIKKKEGG